MTPENTLMAESSCPDELNHDSFSKDISEMLGNRWGEVFHLGGLAGIPFTGNTGWGAFSHHVPDDGNIFVLFSPHVGLTEDGTVGKVHRPGQSHSTSACGASVGAYNFLKQDDNAGWSEANANKNDYQMDYIKKSLDPYMKEILAIEDKNERSAMLATKTYEIAKQFLLDIINDSWMGPNSKLVILGGIMINVDGKGQDLFQPLMFEARHKDGSRVDYMGSMDAKILQQVPIDKLPAPVFKPQKTQAMPNFQAYSAQRHFKSSLPGSQIEQIVYQTIASLGLTKENTVFAESSCPDELNHDDYAEDITKLMADRYGEVFPLGGLAGVPFTGKTGWGAFSHHVPDNGNIVVLFAPHVGITTDGVVGKVHRPGQSHQTSACGASVGAYNFLKQDDSSAEEERHLTSTVKHEHQIQFIVDKLRPSMKSLNSLTNHNEVMTALAYETYKIVNSQIDTIIDKAWMKAESKLVLIGGIMINVDGEAADMFIPLRFEAVNFGGDK